MLVGKGDKHIIIENDSKDEAYKVMGYIHRQLINNKDYINNNILLSIDNSTVHLYILKKAKNVPKIQI